MRTRRQATLERGEAKKASLRNEVDSLLLNLPCEVIVLVLQQLSVRELAVMDAVCKRFSTAGVWGKGLSLTEAAAFTQAQSALCTWEAYGSKPVNNLLGQGATRNVSWKRVVWWYKHMMPQQIENTWSANCGPKDQEVGSFRWRINGFSTLNMFKNLSIALFPKHLQRSCFFTYSPPFLVGGFPWCVAQPYLHRANLYHLVCRADHRYWQ